MATLTLKVWARLVNMWEAWVNITTEHAGYGKYQDNLEQFVISGLPRPPAIKAKEDRKVHQWMTVLPTRALTKR